MAAGVLQVDQIVSNGNISGVVQVPTGNKIQLDDNPSSTNQAAPVSFLDSRYPAGLFLHGLANAKVSISGNVITLTTETGAISATNPLYIAVPKSATAGETSYLSITAALTLTLPSTTINQKICNINTIDGQATYGDGTGVIASAGLTQALEWFLYFLYDGSNAYLGLSLSPRHTHLPANYFYNLSASTLTVAASAATDWAAMLTSNASTFATPANVTAVCLGPAISAIVDGQGSGINGAANSTAGRFSSVSLTTDYIPIWQNRSHSKAQDQQEVQADTTPAYGSADTRIRKYATITSNPGGSGACQKVQVLRVGGAAAANSIGGTELITQCDGYFEIAATDNPTSTSAIVIGFSINSNSRTANVQTLAVANLLPSLSSSLATANQPTAIGWSGFLPAGTVVRVHTNGIAVGTTVAFVRMAFVGYSVR